MVCFHKLFVIYSSKQAERDDLFEMHIMSNFVQSNFCLTEYCLRILFVIYSTYRMNTIRCMEVMDYTFANLISLKQLTLFQLVVSIYMIYNLSIQYHATSPRRQRVMWKMQQSKSFSRIQHFYLKSKHFFFSYLPTIFALKAFLSSKLEKNFFFSV